MPAAEIISCRNDEGPTDITLNSYAPLEYLGSGSGLFVAIIRVNDSADIATMSVIVGPCGGSCGEEIASFSDTRSGAMMAQTVGMAVLRALHLTGSWRPGSSWQQEEA